MNAIKIDAITEITSLHKEIAGHFAQSLTKAIRIGELLTDQKSKLPHGSFTKWIADNLPFTDRTARNYMRLYNRRDELKTETVSGIGITQAYRIIADEDSLEARMEALKAKFSLVDSLSDVAEQITLLHEIIDEAKELEIEAGERRMRAERELGILISGGDR